MPWAPKMLKRKPPPATEIRGTSAERGYDADWQRCRLAVLGREPFCRLCAAKDRVSAATLVDHIIPLADGGERLDDSNLQPLCVECHAIKTGADLANRRQPM